MGLTDLYHEVDQIIVDKQGFFRRTILRILILVFYYLYPVLGGILIFCYFFFCVEVLHQMLLMLLNLNTAPRAERKT